MLTVFTVILLMIYAVTCVVAAHSVDVEHEKLDRKRNPPRGMSGRRRKR